MNLRRLNVLILAGLITGCGGEDAKGTDNTSADAGVGTDAAIVMNSGDSGSVMPPMDQGMVAAADQGAVAPPIEWIAADSLAACEAPATIAADPVTRAANINMVRAQGSPRIVHLLDIEADPANGRLYSVGAGGLFILEYDDGGFEVVTNSNSSGIRGSFDKVEALDEGRIAVSARDRSVTIIDGANTSRISQVGSYNTENPSGMAWSAPYLLVASHTGAVEILDLTDPSRPARVGSLNGLGNPWEVVVQGQRAYVADNSRGVIVMDITDPTAPRLVSEVATAGGAQDLWIDGSTLFVAVGSAGVEAFTLTDPDNPSSISLIDVGSGVVSVSVSDGTLWASDHDSIMAMDVTDPATPVPLGAQRTDQWAMHVFADGQTAFVADWGQISAFRLDGDARAPDADLSRREVFVVEGDEDIRLALTNRGSQPLQLVGASIDDPRFRVEVESTEVGSAQTSAIRLLFMDDGQPVNTELCLATNDGDEAVMRVPVVTNPSGTSAGLGEPAPDFVLRDVDGNTHQLSAQLGNPVVLIYFATW